MRRSSLYPVLAAALLTAAPLGAQQDDALTLRTRVMQIQDTAELRLMERRHEASASVLDQLTAGFAALQLWEVTGRRSHADRSRRHFDRAASAEPGNAWAHYGHALSFAPRITDADAGFFVVEDALARGLGYDAVSRARRALERAVELDPTLPGATALLAQYAVATRDGSSLVIARNTFAHAASAPDAPLDALVGLARTAREQGDYEAAAEAAERAVRRYDPGEADIELARALASLPGNAHRAGESYFDGLAAADDALLAALWDDAAIVARDAEVRRWERAASADQKRTLLAAFWHMRGALGGGTPEERVAEHYQRLNHAWTNHRRWGAFGAPPLNALRYEKTDPRFSDAGLIYIRHGRPEHVWTQGLSRMVWFYRDEDGDPLSYHFMKFADSGWSKDYVLMHRIGCDLDLDVVMYDPRLRSLAFGCSRNSIESVSAMIRRDTDRALRTDTDAPRFEVGIPFHYDLYMFRGSDGETEVVGGFGIPLATIPSSAPPLRLTFAVIDTARFVVARAGGPLDLEGGRAQGDDMLRTHATLSITPTRRGTYRVDVRNADGLAGTTWGGPLVVHDYSGTALRLSDVVLAEPDAEGSFVRGPHRLSLSPSQVFPGGEFKVYYEVYNMPAGGGYRTDITIERADRGVAARLFGRGDATRLQFEDVAPESADGVIRELRDVTAPFEPGEYLMRVRVTGSRGAGTFERERRFTIPER
jgi:tetratricopeptide (TPR) repeat protein